MAEARLRSPSSEKYKCEYQSSRPCFFSGVWVGSAVAALPSEQIVRIAQLVIDPSQLAACQVAVKEEMADSVRLKLGVLTLYSVAEKGHPNRLHFFAI